MDDNNFLFVVECESYCVCGGQCMSCIVCHKGDTVERNREVGGALRLRAAARSYSASKHDIPKAHVDRQVALLEARASSMLNGMLNFSRIDLM